MYVGIIGMYSGMIGMLWCTRANELLCIFISILGKYWGGVNPHQHLDNIVVKVVNCRSDFFV